MISLICEKYNIKNYTINDDGTIDVNGNVNLYNKELTELPLTFNKVLGSFNCGMNKLTSLKGCPRWVEDDFSCHSNDLTSLEFAPDYVGVDFYSNWNNIQDIYCDTEIGGFIHSEIKNDFFIKDNFKIKNYNEWRKLIKRKNILNELYTRHM
jgi:hypothetical protein